VIFGKGFAALVAAEALEAVSMLSKTLAGSTAIVAGHETFPCFFGEKASNYDWRRSLG
jgi:hypothetical protein